MTAVDESRDPNAAPPLSPEALAAAESRLRERLGSDDSRPTFLQDLPPARTNAVTVAARKTLDDLKSDHAASPLLGALVIRLCADIDDTPRPADRIAATRMVMDLLKQLDGALFGTAPLPGAMPVAGDDGGPEEKDPPRHDPFEIGDVPPGVGDAPA